LIGSDTHCFTANRSTVWKKKGKCHSYLRLSTMNPIPHSTFHHRRDSLLGDWFFNVRCARSISAIFVVWFMVFNATFKNISVTSWQSVLFWWRTPQYQKKTIDLHAVCHWQIFSHNVVSTALHLASAGVRTHKISGDRHWLHR
jgi:hypothetical protein